MTEAASQFTILDAMAHKHLWRIWFRDEGGWRPWRTFLSVLFGLPVDQFDASLVELCTGRSALPPGGFNEAWLVCGRRAGKSFILALVACYLGVFKDWKPYLSPGETGTIKIIATDKKQTKVIYWYCRALLLEVPSIEEMVTKETEEQIELSNGVTIEIQSASFRSVRGYTLIAGCATRLPFGVMTRVRRTRTLK
jgi:hypothetical protein